MSAQTLDNGGSPSGSISPIGDVDSWTFVAAAGDAIRVQIGEISGTSFDPLLRIRDPNGVEVASDSGADSTAVAFVAVTSGTFTAEVSDANTTPNGTGTYRIYLARVPGAFVVPSGDEGGALTNGGVHPGAIDLADVDIWTFTAEAFDSVFIQVGELTDVNAFDPRLTLYDPFGNEIATNSGGTAADLAVQVAAAGTYTVLVNEASIDVPASGTYNLYYLNTGPSFAVPAGDQGGALTSGGNHPGAIALGDVDAWTFAADAHDLVHLQIGEVSDANTFDPELRVYDPWGAEIAVNSGGTSADVIVRVPTSGVYTVVIKEASIDVPASGEYLLHYTNVTQGFVVPPGDHGGALTSGLAHDGALTLGDIDAWTFTGRPLDTVHIQIAEVTDINSFDPEIRLYDPLGNEVATNSGGISADIAVQLELAGTYTVVVKEASIDVPAFGAYRLYFTNVAAATTVPPGDEGGAIVEGTVYSAAIELGDIDAWTFTATALDTATVDVIEVVDGGGFDPRVWLYDAFGNLLATGLGGTGTSVGAVLPYTGEYTVVVNEGSFDVPAVGTYTLELDIASGNATEPSGSTSGPLSNGGVVASTTVGAETDKYSLVVAAGQTVRISLDETAPNSQFTPFLRVFGSNGGLLAARSGAAIAELRLAIAAADTLTVVVSNATTSPLTHPYALRVAASAAAFSTPGGDEGGDLGNGQLATGLIAEGDFDLYRVTVAAGSRLRVKVGEAAPDAAFEPSVEVFASSGVSLGRVAAAAIADIALDTVAADVLTVVVSNGQAATGDHAYALHAMVSGVAFGVPAGDEGGPLANGGRIEALVTEADVDPFRLSVAAGDRVRIKASETNASTGIAPRLEVFSPAGVLLAAGGAAAAAELAFDAPVAGDLLVVVDNTSGTTGDYGYSLSAAVAPRGYIVPPLDEGGVLLSGVQRTGVFADADFDVYSVSVTAGDRLVLTVEEQTANTANTPAFAVVAPDGTPLAGRIDAALARAEFRAQTTGTLLVAAWNAAFAAGDRGYTILVTGATGPDDSDGDGLTGAEEVTNGTNPNESDTDGDGLSDGAEVGTYQTDPLQSDTDGDGYSDQDEVTAGSNPLDSGSVPVATQDVPIPLWAILSLAFGIAAAATRRNRLRGSAVGGRP